MNIFTTLFLFTAHLLTPSVALADNLDCANAGTVQQIPSCINTHPTQIQDSNISSVIQSLLNKSLEIFSALFGAAAVLLVIYGGYLYITSAGSPDKIKQGRQAIINAMGAVIIVVSAFFILRVLQSLILVLIPTS